MGPSQTDSEQTRVAPLAGPADPWPDGVFVEQLAAVGAAAFLLWCGQLFQVSSQLPAHPELVWVALLISGAAFVAFGYAVMAPSLSVRRRRAMAVTIVVCMLATCAATVAVQILYVTPFYGTDGIALAHLAAERLLGGLNPYTFNVRGDDLARFGVPEYAITTTTLGHVIGPSVSYPAASFLVYVPALLVGVHDVRWVTLLGQVLGVGILATAAPPSWKILGTLATIGNVDVGVYGTAGGRTDWLWVLPCMLTALDLTSGRVKRAGLWFGLAASMKQQPWLLAPFLVVRLYHSRAGLPSTRIRPVATFGAVAAGVFVLVNLPFIVVGPGDWFRGVAAPALEPLIPHGQGLSLLTQLGLVDLSKSVYSLMAVASLVTLVVAYGRAYQRAPNAVWVLPAFVLWFSYRAYQDYFLYWVPLLVLGLILERRRCALT